MSSLFYNKTLRGWDIMSRNIRKPRIHPN